MTSIFSKLFLENKRNLSISLIIVCVLYIGVVLFANPNKVLSAASKMNISNWLLILSFSLINYCLRFIRWHYYLSYLKHKISLPQHFLYYMAGFSLTITPAKVGETIRSSYLAQHDVPYTHSLAMFFTERFLDVVVIASFSLLSLKIGMQHSSQNINSFMIISVIVIVSFIPLLRQTFVTHFIDRHYKKIPWNFLRTSAQHFIKLLNSARSLFSFKPIYTGLFLGYLAWVIQGIAFYFILTTLNVEITLQQTIGIYAISLLAGALSFIPGGIGTTETVMVLLLTLLGVDTATAIAAALISRLSTLWFAVALGFSAATILSFKK